MPKYMVITRVTSERTYFVEAENEKAAEAKTTEMQPDADEDTNEETLSIVEQV